MRKKSSVIFSPIETEDIIEVVAPGFASTQAERIASSEYLIQKKRIPHIPQGLIAPHFLHANDDASRFSFLKKALNSNQSEVVWCLRGGYGSNRLLPLLSQMKKPKQAKLLIGISDITSLHVFLNQKWGWPSLHAPLLDRLGAGKVPAKCERELWAVLEGKKSEVEFKLTPTNSLARQVGKIKGSVCGGNLTVLQSTIGTPWQLDCRGQFLVVEDLGERGYRVDRILEHLKQSGALKSCRGLIFGEFLGGEESDGRQLWKLVKERWARDLNIPVFKNMEVGHGTIQRPLFLGTPAVLHLGKNAKLVVASAIKEK